VLLNVVKVFLFAAVAGNVCMLWSVKCGSLLVCQ